MAIDPICGMTVSDNSEHQFEYNNKVHNFCSDSCKEKFITATQTQYSCPMHPEVVQDYPGNCPKCGMTLEPGSKS